MNLRSYNILIIGAASAIAIETAKLFADQGASLVLVGRNEEKLNIIATDLRIRGAKKAEIFVLDVNHVEHHPAMLQSALAALGNIDAVLIAHGTLPEQKLAEKDVSVALLEYHTNAVSTIALLTMLANYFEAMKSGCFEAMKSGCIAVITSVAGDRGRRSNYLYGAAKASINVFLQGLRIRLQKSNVQVLTIKPGFVDTPMTANLKKNVLYAQPQQIAKAIHKAIRQGKSKEIYTPVYWKIIMGIIKRIPEPIFRKLNF